MFHILYLNYCISLTYIKYYISYIFYMSYLIFHLACIIYYILHLLLYNIYMCVCVLFHPVFSRVTVPTQLVFMAGPRCWRRLELLAWTSHKTGAGTMGQQWWVYTRCRPHITSNNEFINVEPVSFDIKNGSVRHMAALILVSTK